MKITMPLFVLSFVLFAIPQAGHAGKQSPVTTPLIGTFYLQSAQDQPVPYPFDPYQGQFPVYEIGPGQYLVDDTAPASGGKQSSQGTFTMNSVDPGDGGEEGGESSSSSSNVRNYAKYQGQSFILIDTNIITDTNLLAACSSFPDDTNTTPTLQIRHYGAEAVLIKANHFDYSWETDRDFALILCDKAETPTWKSIDFDGASDAQDGWLVQGLVENFQVTDPMFLMVSNITKTYHAFFRAIPYAGPEVLLSGPAPYDTVSNTIPIYATITDLTGVTNNQCLVSIDGTEARYSLSNNTITLNTKYSPNGWCNVYLQVGNKASVYDPINPFADNAKIFFDGSASLPLQFLNDTYLLFSGNYSNPADIGTNYFMFVTDKPQTITASVYAPSDGRILASYGGFVPTPATISLEWDFTEADGVTPYTNDTYAVYFQTSNPTTIQYTNKVVDGVRPGGGTFITYQEEDPSDLTGSYLNSAAETWLDQTLQQLYYEMYYELGLTQYDYFTVGTNRDYTDCIAMQKHFPDWEVFMRPALTNVNYSDITIGQAHGTGETIGGGPYMNQKFDTFQFAAWASDYPISSKWRLRKSCFWTCYSGSINPQASGGLNHNFPEACGIFPRGVQEVAYMRKNCGLFFGGLLIQGGYGGGTGVTTAQVATFMDQAFVCGKNQYPGGCDPTYSFDFAINATRFVANPEMDRADPRRFGYGMMIFTTRYDDELMRLDTSHVKTF